MTEQVSKFSPTLVEKITGIIKREQEANRKPDDWALDFAESIANRTQILSADEISGLQNRFLIVFQYCTNLMEASSSCDTFPQSAVIYQQKYYKEDRREGRTGNNNLVRHQEGLNQLPPAEAALYLRARRDNKTLLDAQRNGSAFYRNGKFTGRRHT